MGHWAGGRAARASLVTVFLVLAVGLAGCGGSATQAPPTKNTLPTAAASPTASPVVVTGGAKVDVTGTAPGITPGQSLTFVSQVYTLGPTGPLTSPATVTIQLDNALPAGTPIVVATREAPTDSWSYLPATLTSDGQHAQFTTTHLSDFGVMSIDASQIFSDFKASVAPALVSGVVRATPAPTCSTPAKALQDGYAVGTAPTAADAATAIAKADAAAAGTQTPVGTTTRPAPRRKTLFWCLGRSGDTRTVTVVNRRPFAVQVSHGTAAATAVDSKVQGLWASWLGVLAPGSQDTFLAPGGAATYSADLQPKTTLELTTGTSAVAQSLRLLYAAVSAVDVQVQRFGVADPQPLDTFNALLARRTCKNALGQGGAALLTGCFSPRQVMRTYGTNGRLLLPLVTAPGMRLFFNNRSSFLATQGLQVDTQTVYVHRSAPDFGALVGSWSGHTRTLSISATGLVVERISDGCCHRVIDLTYQLSQPQAGGGTTTATATLTRVVVHDRKALGTKPPRVGATGTISLTKGIISAPYVGTSFCGPKAAAHGACGA